MKVKENFFSFSFFLFPLFLFYDLGTTIVGQRKLYKIDVIFFMMFLNNTTSSNMEFIKTFEPQNEFIEKQLLIRHEFLDKQLSKIPKDVVDVVCEFDSYFYCKKLNLSENFNFNDDVKNFDEIDLIGDILYKKCFLAKCPMEKTNMGEIARKGDLFYGVKNNGLSDIKIMFYHYPLDMINHKEPFATLIVKSGEIGYIKNPLILIKNFMGSGSFSYKIEENDKKNTNNIFYNMFNVFSAPTLFDIEFIYGYLTNTLRKFLCESNVYSIIDDKFIYLYYGGRVIDWIWMLFYMYYPSNSIKINSLYHDNYMYNKYKDDEIFEEFRKLNINWIEIF